MSEVIVVRTDHYDEMLDAFITGDLLKTGREILVVADESRQRVEIPANIHKVVADPARLGVYATEDVMWRCGDYAVYEAMEAFPRASAFWLIEPDVRIHASDVKRFFDGSGARTPPDFLTAHFGPSNPDWMWHRTMTPFAPQVFICMMQFCRLSQVASRYLYGERLKLGAAFANGEFPAADWPNDEAFVLSLLVPAGFSFGPLSDHAPHCSISGTFTFTKPISAKWLRSLPPDEALYHPVVGGDKYLRRARAYLAERAYLASHPDEILNEFEREFPPRVRAECGDESGLVFQDEIRKVADWVARRHSPALARED